MEGEGDKKLFIIKSTLSLSWLMCSILVETNGNILGNMSSILDNQSWSIFNMPKTNLFFSFKIHDVWLNKKENLILKILVKLDKIVYVWGNVCTYQTKELHLAVHTPPRF